MASGKKTAGAQAPKASQADEAAGKEVATTKAAGLPAEYDYGDAVDYGTYSSADLVIPALNILQGLSPQVVKKPGDGGLKGARVGMLCMSVTDELIDGDEGIGFIPIYVYQDFVEWIPKERGGGLVARYPLGHPYIAECIERNGGQTFGKIPIGEKNKDGIPEKELVETKYIYGRVIRNDEPAELIVLRFSSSKIKVWQNLLYRLDMFVLETPNGKVPGKRIPKFAHRLRIKTVAETSKKGDFYNFAFEPYNEDILSSMIPANSPWMATNKAIADNIHKQRETLTIEGDQGGEAADNEIPF